jgi:YebC/PmpR family DNA-binding regulatory protein
MSGHSKWATIKHKKGATDAKRGKAFTRLIKEITIAAKGGGGDPDGNPRLRTAILAAKAENMPAENIKRAVQRGTGELEGLSYEEIVYEGYGPGGAAIMIQVLTDNKNRAVSEIRHAFQKNNGNLGESGSVSYLFAKKGVIAIDKSKVNEDKLTEIALEAGADDLSDEGETWEVVTGPKEFDAVLEAIKAAGIKPEYAEVTMVALDPAAAGREPGDRDDAAAGGAGRPGRHAECVHQLRYGRGCDGGPHGMSTSCRSRRFA